ncbi:hypothetical protein [Siminovitchia fortis]|uniref:hypothetical protein n=1 Tax=Siminovitchia fortis TaxID=254758 RepID=UPI0011A13368|nr:hypothetical protein [Siminovitchia fortis]
MYWLFEKEISKRRKKGRMVEVMDDGIREEHKKCVKRFCMRFEEKEGRSWRKERREEGRGV